MLEIAGDFHTHTTHSHGTGTVEDNVLAAIDRGLLVVAISDHGTGHLFYNIGDMQRYLHDIEEVREKYKGQIRVYSGYEANLQSLGGRLDIPQTYAHAIDVPFFGYHKMVRYPAPADWLHFMLPKSSSASSVQKNTKAYENAAHKNRIRFISHPGYGLPVDKDALAGFSRDTGVALEINSKHPEFTVEELSAAADAGAMFIIGSDAHSPKRVGDFRAATDKAQEAGISPYQILNSVQNIETFMSTLEDARRERGPIEFRDILSGMYQET